MIMDRYYYLTLFADYDLYYLFKGIQNRLLIDEGFTGLCGNEGYL
jgi:hypothetical protein